MAQQTFQPGDIVQLKSGGPKMTVTVVDGDNIYCMGYDANAHQFIEPRKFLSIVLKKIDEEGRRASIAAQL
jgi:uncharacterized protein YodC (DUF2158 family)